MKPNRLLLAMASAVMASQLMAGEAVFYVTEEGEAVRDLAVAVDGKKKLVGKSGFVSFDVNSGTHTVELSQFGEFLGEFDFDTASNQQNAEIQVEMVGGEALPEINVYTPGQEQAPALGQISGYLESEDTGGAISGARISIAGTDQAVVTDEEGFFSFELARGEYDLVISDPNYGKRDVSGLRVMANVNTGVNLNLTLEGDGVIEEVVAVGSYIPSTATAQERDSSAVLNAIGSEQLARFGDSNAASALKRVVGVSVADGKYVVVRGLNERHSTIMLNGASLPSPDPSRRVVPLDIFPSSILDGIEVQKTFTPDVYADSTGGVVRLKTKKFPDEFEGKFSASLGYTDGLTGEERSVQKSEGTDIFGFGANGDRAMPKGSDSKKLSSSRAKEILNELPDNLKTEDQTIIPDLSLELALGNTVVDNDDYTLGYNFSVKYSNEWSKEDSTRRSLIINGGNLDVNEEFNYTRTSNDINLGTGLTVGVIAGDHEITSNTLLLRQTHAETTGIKGVSGDQNREVLKTNMLWLERQFLMQQFTGDHYFPEFSDTEVEWQVSTSEASLDSPDERSYSFERDGDDSSDPYALYWSSLQREYNELTDSNTDISVNAISSLLAQDSYELKAKYGFSTFAREREADNTTLSYDGPGQRAEDFAGETQIDKVISGAKDKGYISIDNRKSSAANDYSATWDLTAAYLMSEFKLYEQFDISIGARLEDSELKVDTFSTTSSISNPIPISALVEDNDVFASLLGTYYINDDVQLRGAYYQTKNRPDFRELANAQFKDPEEGDTLRGNPSLVSAEVDNFDLRAEWYLSDSENISVAVFSKDFKNAIEKTLLQGGKVFSWKNAEGTSNLQGIEWDFRKEFEVASDTAFVSGNFAIIDSEVNIVVDGQKKKQSMQGQPKKLANLQLGFDHFDSSSEVTFLVNYQGETLHSVAGGILPNVMREARTEVAISLSSEILEDIKFKAKLKNLLDDEVLLTQGGEDFRKYKKGVEGSVGISMNF